MELSIEKHCEDTLEEVSQVFKVLGDPSRIRIMAFLAGKEYSVNEIAEALNMSQSGVSHQLKTLRSHRLVRHKRRGQNIIYSFDNNHVIKLMNEAIIHSNV